MLPLKNAQPLGTAPPQTLCVTVNDLRQPLLPTLLDYFETYIITKKKG